jgi:hypothetical protein
MTPKYTQHTITRKMSATKVPHYLMLLIAANNLAAYAVKEDQRFSTS